MTKYTTRPLEIDAVYYDRNDVRHRDNALIFLTIHDPKKKYWDIWTEAWDLITILDANDKQHIVPSDCYIVKEGHGRPGFFIASPNTFEFRYQKKYT